MRKSDLPNNPARKRKEHTYPMSAQPAPISHTPTQRDPRLDFYRGLAMFIILVAHIPGNTWTLWIPARFGFSDATEIFVFCSGMASAIAFGRSFTSRGWVLGTARVLFRCWQVYWAHIGTFLVIAALMAVIDNSELFEKSYVGSLNLWPFFNKPLSQLPSLMTLSYVPNYFDVLPMYIGILLLMPLVIALRNLHLALAIVFVLAIWLLANLDLAHFPAEPWSNRKWFFNPFGWQLVFFTGFALMSGWFPAPPRRLWLVAVSALAILATVPFAYFRVLNALPDLRETANSIRFLTEKTDFGLFRYLHFLALAYLGWWVAGENGHRIIATGTGFFARIWRVILTVILKVGQQSLAVFVFSMVLARLLGFALDQTDETALDMFAANTVGFALIIGIAYLTGWFKSQPWRRKA